MRWKMTIEYDGLPFVGWQRQKNGKTIQEVIEASIFAFSKEVVTLYGAGRTDSVFMPFAKRPILILIVIFHQLLFVTLLTFICDPG